MMYRFKWLFVFFSTFCTIAAVSFYQCSISLKGSLKKKSKITQDPFPEASVGTAYT